MKYIFSTFLVFAFIASSWAQNIPEKPNPARFVNDFADVLSEQEEYELEQKLRNYQDTTSNQFVIVTIEGLEGYDIESYSYTLASKWGIGQKGKNNGILITLAEQEHKVRIEVGYGLEGVVPDLVAKRVIREVMTPNFKQGRFYTGLDEGTTHLIKYASGEFKAEPKSKKVGSSAMIIIAIIIIVIIFSIISKVNRVRGQHIGGALDLWTILALLGSSGGNHRNRGGGWGSGSGDSGGGWDFGGGDFGGGGASGDW